MCFFASGSSKHILLEVLVILQVNRPFFVLVGLVRTFTRTTSNSCSLKVVQGRFCLLVDLVSSLVSALEPTRKLVILQLQGGFFC